MQNLQQLNLLQSDPIDKTHSSPSEINSGTSKRIDSALKEPSISDDSAEEAAYADAASSPLKPEKQLSAHSPHSRAASGLVQGAPTPDSLRGQSQWRDSARLTYRDEAVVKTGLPARHHDEGSDSRSSDRGSVHYAAGGQAARASGALMRASVPHTTTESDPA